MPSRWCRRLPADRVVADHIVFVTQESERVRRTIAYRGNLRYGQREKLDLFGVESLPAEAPIFVYFSGGYWQELSGDVSAYPVEPLVKAGVVVAVVDYDRAPGVTLTTIVSEAIKATKFVLDYAKQKGSRSIVLCGHSAGSHLVAMVASSSWLSSLPSCDRAIFRGVVHLSGVFDLRPLLDTSINDAVGADEKEALANSPLAEDNAIRAAENSKNWKTLLFVGENDAPGLKAQGEHYAEKLRALVGVESAVTFQVVPVVDHFDLVEKLSRDSYEVTRAVVKLSSSL